MSANNFRGLSLIPAWQLVGPSRVRAVVSLLALGRLDGRRVRVLDGRLMIDVAYADAVARAVERRYGRSDEIVS